MRYQTAFPKGKKQGGFLLKQGSDLSEFLNDLQFSIIPAWFLTNIHLHPVFYATFGLRALEPLDKEESSRFYLDIIKRYRENR
jgi:hypothetical protein